LITLGKLELLKSLFSDVVISREVFEELGRISFLQIKTQQAINEGWLTVVDTPDPVLVNRLLQQVDLGEATAITLALTLAADFLVIDERAGSKLAETFGLRTVGVLGILLESKKAGLIPVVQPLLDQLRTEVGFWVSDRVYTYVLEIAGEQ
jgi:hypothetical protein